ncbi:MAG: hypothetical protein U0792_24620 [Gemmataceae bacterium]
MHFYQAVGNGQDSGAWGLLPPLLSDGTPVAAAAVLDTDTYLDTELLFPISRAGYHTDLTFFYWQAYVATPKGRDALEQLCRNPLKFSPARTIQGDKLWLVRAPGVSGAIDDKHTIVKRHPSYADRHPLAHLSGRVRSLGNIHLLGEQVSGRDLFYLAEYPVFLLISDFLVNGLRDLGISGWGIVDDPAIAIS